MLPRLTQTRSPLTHQVRALTPEGGYELMSVPAERALTVYVDRHELVTLMTLGAHPEWLVLGYLRNQRLIARADAIESITVDWTAGEGDSGVAAVKTRQGIEDLSGRTARRVVTSGCGQGSLFGDLLDELDALSLPPGTLTQSALYDLLNTIRLQESTYKSAGSVHGCALFQGPHLKIFVEDVGRHNAIDTIAGWSWMQGEESPGGADPVFYTTGRLTSEMVLKSAQMGVPIIVSRSGITQMGHDMAERLGMCTIGRATHRHFYCYSGHHRFVSQPALASAAPKVTR